MLYTNPIYKCVRTLAIPCALIVNAAAADQDSLPKTSPHTHARSGATLMQADVLNLAKTTAKRETGRAFDDYQLDSVIFDPQSREWTVSFQSKARQTSKGCLIVVVNDATRATKMLRC
jgi:hypothetical protein